MSGVYWCLTAMDLMGQLERMNKEQVLSFVKECQKPSGGFSPAPDHDAHLLYTLSAIQVSGVLCTCVLYYFICNTAAMYNVSHYCYHIIDVL